MAEEHGFQAPEGYRLCVNNCGFLGSATTQNMCSKCYNDVCGGDSPLFSTHSAAAQSTTPIVFSPERAAAAVVATEAVAELPPAAAGRCFTCRKKVGLVGFRCRCGTTFCGTHRYPEKHGCGFDFKAVGKEAIAKANPVVKAMKLEKM